LKVAVRSIAKNKFFSVINITGLAIGMAVCFLILIWVQYELSYDKFHKDIDRTYMIFMKHKHSAGTLTISMTPAPLAEALKEKYPEIISTARFNLLENVPVNRNDDRFIAAGAAVDPQFFEMFTFPIESGNPETSLNDFNSILISRDLARTYFAGADPIGKDITIYNDYSFTVKAWFVIPLTGSGLSAKKIFSPISFRGAAATGWHRPRYNR
jgi:putative ABC transport system permease protein